MRERSVGDGRLRLTGRNDARCTGCHWIRGTRAMRWAWARDSHRDPGIESHRGVQTGPPRLGRICWTLARLSSFAADTQSRPKSVGRPTSVNSIPCRTRVPTTADPRQRPWPVRAEFPSSGTRQNSFYCPATVRLLSGKFQSLPMTLNTFPQVRGCLPSSANWYRWAWPPRRPKRQH